MTEKVIIQGAKSENDYLAIHAEAWDETSLDDYEGPNVTVEISSGGLHAVAVLPGYVADVERLAVLMHEIDQDWRGWTGVKSASPDDEWLAVRATHDGAGHVALTIQLADGWPMVAAWRVNVTFAIDVGSAARFAAALDQWTAAVWPPQYRHGTRA
jgi:hypothetical protein